MKDNIINSIVSGFSSMGVSFTQNEDCDISINTEFLDASWGAGNRKLSYQAKILLDQAASTVFMWEFTKESGGGISFKADSESTFQSGTTLFRKVKSVQYGPEGKVVEFELDLGAIPKVVKEAVKNNGWKFKTVMNKDKAMFGKNSQPVQTPVIPIEPPMGQVQPGLADSQKVFVNHVTDNKAGKNGVKKAGILFWLAFIVLIAATVLLFVGGKTSTTGWIIGLAVLFIIFLLKNKLAAKGCLIQIVFWLIIVVAIFLVYTFTSDTSANTQSKGKEPVSTSSQEKDDTKKNIFTLNQFMVSSLAIDDFDYKNNQSNPYVYAPFVISINKESNDDSAFEVKSLKATNFKVVSKGSGTVSFYRAMGKDNTFDFRKRDGYEIKGELSAKAVTLDALMSTVGESAFNPDKMAGGYAGRLEFTCLEYKGKIDAKAGNNALTTEEMAKLLTPVTISFDVVVENGKGEKYVKSFTQELFTKEQIVDAQSINNLNPEAFIKK